MKPKLLIDCVARLNDTTMARVMLTRAHEHRKLYQKQFRNKNFCAQLWWNSIKKL